MEGGGNTVGGGAGFTPSKRGCGKVLALLKGPNSIVVIWVNIFQNELMSEIYLFQESS